MTKSFSGWLFENELMLENYVVYHGGSHDQGTKLVAVSETKNKYTEIGIGTEEGEFRIILRPLGGEMVKGGGFGGSAKYLVCECSPPETSYEKQLMVQVQTQFGKNSLRHTIGGALPDFMTNALKQATGSDELPKGITVKTNNVLFIIYTESIDYYIKSVVDYVVTVTKPIVEQGFIDYVHCSGVVKVDLMSDRFRQEQESHAQNHEQSIGYLRTALNAYLGSRYPLALQVVDTSMKWHYENIPPSTVKVKLTNNPAIQRVLGEVEGMSRYIIEALLKGDDATLALMETVIKSADHAHLDRNLLAHWQFMEFIDAQQFERFLDNKMLGVLSLPEWFFDDKFEKTLDGAGLGRRYDLVKHEFEQEITKSIQEGEASHLPWNTILKHYEKLDLPPEIKDAIRNHAKEQERQKQEAHEKRLKERTKNAALLHPGNDEHKWVKAGETEWHDVKQDYLNYNVSHKGGYYDILVGELAIEEGIVDREDLFYDAVEKAEKEASRDVQQRPSKTYGQDRDEVLQDIDYHADEFLDDFLHNQEEDPDEPDPNDTDAWVELIKTQYYNEFLKWRKSKMIEKEDENSWEYEPDTESHDFQAKVHEIENELAEQAAWEEGLVTLVQNHDGIVFTLDSRHWSTFLPFFKQTLQWNWSTRDPESNEPYIQAQDQIEVHMVDKARQRKSLHDWLALSG